MGVEIHNRQFYCNTADVPFGPLFRSDNEGEAFLAWMIREEGDPRRYSWVRLVVLLHEFRNAGAYTFWSAIIQLRQQIEIGGSVDEEWCERTASELEAYLCRECTGYGEMRYAIERYPGDIWEYEDTCQHCGGSGLDNSKI